MKNVPTCSTRGMKMAAKTAIRAGVTRSLGRAPQTITGKVKSKTNSKNSDQVTVL